MNIAIFTNNYLPNPYGVSSSVESFRKQFEKKGHIVYVFAPGYKKYKDENSNVFRYPSIDFKYKISFPLAIPYSPKISEEIDSLKFDIVHSQHPNLLGTEASKWAKKKNIPLVFTWHTLYDQYAHFVPLIPRKIASAWAIKNASGYANNADQIIVPTESIKKIIKNWGVSNENIESIPTGVEEIYFQNVKRRKTRSNFGIFENEVLLILVSRISSEKNIEFLFKSVMKILQKKEKVKFLIAGGGHLIPKCKEMIFQNSLGERVIFAGEIPRKELGNYYAAGDIFVYASKSETQGMIVSEAMYCGLPIVAVNATGICDLVKDKINGFLVSEDDEEFVQSVIRLIENKGLRKEFSENSKKIAHENYTDSVCAEKMLQIYDKTIKRKKA